MSTRFVLVQLSDLHIGAAWADGDPVASARLAIASIRQLQPAPGAVLISGDLADHASTAEYEQVLELLAAVDAPHYVLPGNHDDRDALRSHFDAPAAPAGTPLQYAVDLGPLRLVALDSTRPGADEGQLDDSRLEWLERTLAADADTPTLLAMHHPPFRTGAPAFDAMGLATHDRDALAEVVGRHPNVSAICGGHFHRAIIGQLAGRRAIAAPSTYSGFALDFTTDRPTAVVGPPGLVVHLLEDGELASHIEAVRPTTVASTAV